MPIFVVHTLRSLAQVKKSAGFLDGKLLPDRRFTSWTMTAWDLEEDMRAYMVQWGP